MLADKDECSALDPNLFASGSSVLGPLSSFRCVHFGYACTEPDMTTPGPRTHCVPDSSSTVIEDPAGFIPLLRAQAVDPRRVAVGSIIAPNEVAIELRVPGESMTPIPAIASSCTWPDSNNQLEAADPAVRLAWLTNADLGAAMTTMGINARRAMGDPCIEADLDLAQCTAVEEVDGVETPLPACASPTQTDCYELAIDPVTCPNAAHRELVVHRSAAAPTGYDLLRCR